jgi:hypothetical protein
MHEHCNNEGHSNNHCCSGKAVSITYSEGAFVALVTQHAMRMRHIVICVLPDSTIFSTLSHERHDLKKKITEYKMRCFISSTTFI